MRKSTILMIAVVFVASVLIVGIFGMKIFSIGNVNYVKEMNIDKSCFEFNNISDNKFSFTTKENEDGTFSYDLKAIIPSSGSTLTIKPILVKTDEESELTNPEIRITLITNNDIPKTFLNDGILTLTGRENFKVLLETTDGSNLKVMLTVGIYVG